MSWAGNVATSIVPRVGVADRVALSLFVNGIFWARCKGSEVRSLGENFGAPPSQRASAVTTHTKVLSHEVNAHRSLLDELGWLWRLSSCSERKPHCEGNNVSIEFPNTLSCCV